MIKIRFPDGAARDFPAGITGAEIAAAISKSLAKRAIAMTVDGDLTDLTDLSFRGASDQTPSSPIDPPGSGEPQSNSLTPPDWSPDDEWMSWQGGASIAPRAGAELSPDYVLPSDGAAVSSVPEPASLFLLAAGAPAVARRRQRAG